MSSVTHLLVAVGVVALHQRDVTATLEAFVQRLKLSILCEFIVLMNKVLSDLVVVLVGDLRVKWCSMNHVLIRSIIIVSWYTIVNVFEISCLPFGIVGIGLVVRAPFTQMIIDATSNT